MVHKFVYLWYDTTMFAGRRMAHHLTQGNICC